MIKKIFKKILRLPFRVFMRIAQPVHDRLNYQTLSKLDLLAKQLQDYQHEMRELAYETDRMILNFLKSDSNCSEQEIQNN